MENGINYLGLTNTFFTLTIGPRILLEHSHPLLSSKKFTVLAREPALF
jgi:hypothetical protein